MITCCITKIAKKWSLSGLITKVGTTGDVTEHHLNIQQYIFTLEHNAIHNKCICFLVSTILNKIKCLKF